MESTKEIKKTILYEEHLKLGGKMVEFADWLMPLYYSEGILKEHLQTRKYAGIFDVSHMGRIVIEGKNSLEYLQYVLTKNASAILDYESQYTIISDENGCAIDDAYLYHIFGEKYLLVVNASNKHKDLLHLNKHLYKFKDVKIIDKTEEISMLSLQGPKSKEILLKIIDHGYLPEPLRNKMSQAKTHGSEIIVARTGYTGEPLCFELFIDYNNCLKIWNELLNAGAFPIGLGARDSLRIEAELPLYGHELGKDLQGEDIPIFASSLSKFAVSFSDTKGDFIGKEALLNQFNELKKIQDRDFSDISILSKLIVPLEIIDTAIARSGDKVYHKEKHVGYITSGTVAPYWSDIIDENINISENNNSKRSICLALIDSKLREDTEVYISVREKMNRAFIMPYLLKSETPPFARPIIFKKYYEQKCNMAKEDIEIIDKKQLKKNVFSLLNESINNTLWRQKECINLIPSEQTPSKLVKLLSILDPMGRYAEHKKIQAFYDKEFFYYQGTDFINKIEELLSEQLITFLGCKNIEARPISGQMANTIVFSALIDFLNRSDKNNEPRRLSSVLNHHIISGGHLSAQPMGALKDFISIDPKTDKPAVVSFPVLAEDPFRIDLGLTFDIIEKYKPELIIFGKSMTIYKEPVKEIKEFIKDFKKNILIMYDMAHVFGLVGQYFQEPFKEGADIVTASTHKTFFGTQRGIIASNFVEDDLYYQLWKSINNRTFPGSTSNHHLGTLLGLLMACFEMNYFKEEYQRNVLNNSKILARALKSYGLNVAGNPNIGYTETHQVILNVGFLKGLDIAKKLEENNIIVNFQATPVEEGFTAAGALRLGVAEMSRFGMGEKEFKKIAYFMNEVINHDKNVKTEIKKLRENFLEMKFCFQSVDYQDFINEIYNLL